MGHTPGPWEVVEDTQDEDITIQADIGDETVDVALVYGAPLLEDGSENEDIANAHLIAAAPELLECLEVLNEIVSRYWGKPFTSGMIDGALGPRIQQAIAKAKRQK